jgi:hypothetical protein
VPNKRFQRTPVLVRLTWRRELAPLKRNTLGIAPEGRGRSGGLSMVVGYRVVERFTPSDAAWRFWVGWSGLTDVVEVVGLDSSLCPPVERPSASDSYDRRVFIEFIDDCFDDPDYAVARLSGVFDPAGHQVLALAREPRRGEVQGVALPGFRFAGFELCDEPSPTSALTNVGGLDAVLRPGDRNTLGLVSDWDRAAAIRDELAVTYPDEPHADCTLWAVWRRE